MAIEWFQNNFMKLNEGKCRLLISGFKHEVIWPNVGNKNILESKEKQLLYIKDWVELILPPNDVLFLLQFRNALKNDQYYFG